MRRPSPTIAVICLLGALCALCGECLAQERPPWWNQGWPYRMLVSVPPAQPGQPRYASVWVHLRQDADGGGGALRVIAPDGRTPVPFAVMHATPEGRCLIAFEVGRRTGLFGVYYGNSAAGPVDQAEPAVGLLYETRPIPEGASVSSWADAQATVNRAGPSFGADYWIRIYDAYNPFGPQRDYIGIYRGYIDITEPGSYGFATMSDDSSFLLIDGKPVTQWVGRHNIHQGRRGERSGTVELTRRAHEILYVHFAFGAPARAALAWMPPGKDRFEIVPHSAFPRPRQGQVMQGEGLRQTVSADFTWEPESYCEAGKAQMIAVKFTSRSTTAGDALIERYGWDFGDGQSAGDSGAWHVFLTPGVYTVTHTVRSTGGARVACAKRVKVGPMYEDLDFPRKKLEQFWDSISGYRMDRLPTASLLSAWEFLKHLEKRQEATEVAGELYGRRQDLTPVQFHETAMALGEHAQSVGRDPDGAEAYFRAALDAVPERDRQRRFSARFALCDLYFYYAGDPDRARREYVKLRADFPQTDPARRRVALIRIADTYRDQGKVDDARRTYEEAEADPAFAPDKPRSLVAGSMLQEVLSHLHRGDGEQALERLEKLLWHYPTMRLEGQPAELRVQAALLKGDFTEAKKQADSYIGFARDPNYVPAVLIGAAEACIELGLLDEAADHYRKVLDSFAESPQVEDARNGLRRLGE